MQFHEVANIFPMMTEAEIADLAADIKTNGLIETIWTYRGQIVDGRNRYRACLLVGEPPRYQGWNGDEKDLVGFVLALNLKRRHLDASQRAVIGLAVEKYETGKAKERMLATQNNTAAKEIIPQQAQGAARDIAAAAVGVNPRYIQDAKRIESKAPDLIPLIASGEMNIPQAKREMKQRARRDAIETYEPPVLEQVKDGPFGVIYADPPWRYDFAVSGSREIENNYPTMSVDEICALPVWEICAPDCVLYLWATSPKLPEAMQTIAAWGFEYKTCAVWVKDKIGMGYYFRQQHELLLVATRGAPEIPPPGIRLSSVIYGERSEHSKKPIAVAEILEAWYPHIEKVELFCRTPRVGWYAWGNQA